MGEAQPSARCRAAEGAMFAAPAACAGALPLTGNLQEAVPAHSRTCPSEQHSSVVQLPCSLRPC